MTVEGAWEPHPGWTLSDWCNCYRVCGLDVTIRGGEYVGLWISERIVAVVVDETLGAAILEAEPTTALAQVDRDRLILLATGDVSASERDVPGVAIISEQFVYRLPTGHPADPYLWRMTPDTALAPLSAVLAAERELRAHKPV